LERRLPSLFVLLLTFLALPLATPARAAHDSDSDRSGERRPQVEADAESPPERLSKEELAERAAGRGDRVPVGTVVGNLRLQSHSPTGLDWTFLGPRPITGGYWTNGRNASGRVSAILPHPSNSSIVYIAAAGGGVWKTTDAGVTWTPLTDGLSSLQSGALCFEAGNPNTVFYATGEQHSALDNFPGDGLFRSTDAGANWTKIAPYTETGSYVARIIAHPSTPGLMFIASDFGFMRSTDGGATWDPFFAGDWCTDVVMNPVNPNEVFSAHWGVGIYKSPDGGVTQIPVGGGLPATGAGFGRIQLAFAPSDSHVVYASYHRESTGGLFGLYKSTDGGATWSALVNAPNYLGTQGWYDHTLIVHPTNPSLVFAGGVFPYDASTRGVVRTTNGGNSWTDVMTGANGEQLHPDVHHMAYDASGRLWVSNDGGVWRTSDNGSNWTNCNGNLAITQFYFAGVHPSDPNRLLGGTQDNGTLQYAGAVGWPEWIAGDGGAVLYEQDDPSWYYTTYTRLNPIYRWHHPNYDGDATGPWVAAADRTSFIFNPIVEDPNVPGGLLCGTYRVWRSLDRGTTWSAISPDLSAGSGVIYALAVANGDMNTIYAGTTDGYIQRTTDGGTNWDPRVDGLSAGRIRRIVLDPADSDHAFCVVERRTDARLFETTDGGDNWNSVTGDLPEGLITLCMTADWRTAVPRLYAGTDLGVFVSSDRGAAWHHADTALPNTVVYDLGLDLANDGLVAATHGRGMWRAHTDVLAPSVAVVSPNGGNSLTIGANASLDWTAADDATVTSVDLELSRAGIDGPWETVAAGIANTGSYAWAVTGPVSLDARLRVRAHDNSSNSAEDLSDASFAITDGPTAVEPVVSAGQLALAPITPNPSRGRARIDYTLPAGGAARVSVLDVQGRELQVLAHGVHSAGPHQVWWDGRSAAPGLYFVRLSARGESRIQRVVVTR
jgi:photosystem II stability/assembly factor-like uncharacterized protein